MTNIIICNNIQVMYMEVCVLYMMRSKSACISVDENCFATAYTRGIDSIEVHLTLCEVDHFSMNVKLW